ncbi:flagellar protein FlgJ [Novimethylophilus kurashikiensis]|uniref:Peptidoglycan hydrolase FlgJ n=1 Tax=Novimethylophilus kurashikiensis TaxID=1825523 RepID=A0A2R5FC98_9PROT|nr:flagellar assembly peptidoglycan hydrolase FlgJ [Novimethylophilus kurashikiensis]GBG15820.1 flagellar protein FlgJ [Novimethylophilus kurashikiensis]
MTSIPFSNQLAIDPQSLGSLHKLTNGTDTKEGIKAAAKQFEAYFLQMMLRSMRETVSQDGPFDSQETKTFTDMFDQQVAQSISQSRGMGLGDALTAQIEQQMNLIALSKQQPAAQTPAVTAAGVVEKAAETSAPDVNGTSGGFLDKLWPHAVDAAKSLGVAPHLLLGQAALESGWGKHELKSADGSNSHNLFNLKAGSNWHGPTVEKQVTEYVNGKPVQSTEKFRAYGSYKESFADYAKLISGSPRYAGALNQDAAGFARGLQQGGYATDPDYGNKLMRVISSPAFRNQLASADAA